MEDSPHHDLGAIDMAFRVEIQRDKNKKPVNPAPCTLIVTGFTGLQPYNFVTILDADKLENCCK